MWAWVCVLCSSAWNSQMAPGANLLLLLSYTHSYLSCVYSDISSDQSFYTLLSEVRRTQGVLELTVHADLLTQWHIFSHSSILSTAFLEPITWANYCWAHKGQRSMLLCTDSSICSDCSDVEQLYKGRSSRRYFNLGDPQQITYKTPPLC